MPPHMTVAEFLDWEPDDRSGRLWQLRDGEPEMMAPASDRHGSIQTRAGLSGHHPPASHAARPMPHRHRTRRRPRRTLRGQLPGARPRHHLRAANRRAPDGASAGADRDPVAVQRIQDPRECPRLPDDIGRGRDRGAAHHHDRGGSPPPHARRRAGRTSQTTSPPRMRCVSTASVSPRRCATSIARPASSRTSPPAERPCHAGSPNLTVSNEGSVLATDQ